MMRSTNKALLGFAAILTLCGHGVHAQYEPCSICGDCTLTNPSGQVPIVPGLIPGVTDGDCSIIEKAAQDGLVHPELCAAATADTTIQESCGCECENDIVTLSPTTSSPSTAAPVTPVPTPTPTFPPTEILIVGTTNAPTFIATDVMTFPPSSNSTEYFTDASTSASNITSSPSMPQQQLGDDYNGPTPGGIGSKGSKTSPPKSGKKSPKSGTDGGSSTKKGNSSISTDGSRRRLRRATF